MTALRDPLSLAWAALMGLSLASTALAALRGDGLSGPVVGAAILLAAWAKMRLILCAYLGLSAAPALARGFDAVLAGFVLLLWGLALVPVL